MTNGMTNGMTRSMTSAAIYARVSSARQKKDETIASQTAALRAHAEQLGLDVPARRGRRGLFGIWALADRGLSTAAEKPTKLDPDVVEAADVVITMGCGETCRSSRASATRTGPLTTRPARTPTPCAGSSTTSTAGPQAPCRTRRHRERVRPRPLRGF